MLSEKLSITLETFIFYSILFFIFDALPYYWRHFKFNALNYCLYCLYVNLDANGEQHSDNLFYMPTYLQIISYLLPGTTLLFILKISSTY